MELENTLSEAAQIQTETPHVLSYMWSLASNLMVFVFNLDHK